MNLDTTMASRLEGAVWGHLVGDALGVPYEFEPGPARDVRWGHSGTHGQPPGTWSDDGGLMLALLDSLLTVGFNLEDQARRAVDWMDGPAYKPGPRFDIGIGTAQALARVKQGTRAIEAGGRGEGDNGNGSLMRILPVALAGLGLPACEVAARACLASCVTHAHPRSRAACAVYSLLVRALLNGARDRDQVMALSFGHAGRCLDQDVRPELEVLRGYQSPTGSGYVVDCFWSAWDAFRAAESYRDCVERAVAFGNDTDTTAAVAGGLAGTYWGVEGIPADWLRAMHGRDIVEPLVARLLTAWAAR